VQQLEDSLERLRNHLEAAEEGIPEEGTEGMPVEGDILKEGTEEDIEVQLVGTPAEEDINWDMQEESFPGMLAEEDTLVEDTSVPASLAEPSLALQLASSL